MSQKRLGFALPKLIQDGEILQLPSLHIKGFPSVGPQDLGESIEPFLRQKFRIEHALDVDYSASNIMVSEPDAFRFYFRIRAGMIDWDNYTLVIAVFAIPFADQDYDLELLCFLLRFSKKHNLNKIGLENVETSSRLHAFAIRFGFKRYSNGSNWMAGVCELIDRVNLNASPDD